MTKKCVLLVSLLVSVASGNFTLSDFAQIKVGAYYYPWYGANFHGGQYLRHEIGQVPALGEYDDTQPQVIEQHLKWSREANIGVWISSWWGRYSREDNTTRNVILPVLEGTTHEIALLYETTGILNGENGTRRVLRVEDDLEYILKYYVDHPNYYHIRGRPVIFVYLSRVLDDDLSPILLLMRSAAARQDVNLYIVGDQAFGVAPAFDEEYLPFSYLDAVTNYDVYGTLPKPFATAAGLTKYYHEQAMWREGARRKECKFIPSVSPGFNDRGVRLEVDHMPLSRKLNNESSAFGSLFEYALRKAIPQVDRGADRLLMVNSFNEWHEDTQIEPVNGRLTSVPFNYTQGIQYEAYGSRYLDLLYKMTTDGSWIADEKEEIAWLEKLEEEVLGPQTPSPTIAPSKRPSRVIAFPVISGPPPDRRPPRGRRPDRDFSIRPKEVIIPLRQRIHTNAFLRDGDEEGA